MSRARRWRGAAALLGVATLLACAAAWAQWGERIFIAGLAAGLC